MAFTETTITSGSSNKGCNLVFSFVWIGFSSLFLIFGLGVLYKGLIPSAWKQVPCVVEHFEIIPTANQECFTATVLFQYEWEGRRYSSTRFSTSDTCEPLYEDLAEWQARYLGPDPAVCYILPDTPAEAALQVGSRWAEILTGLVMAGFGGVFVTIGIFVFRSGTGHKVSLPDDESMTNKSLTAKKAAEKGTWILIVFLGVFGTVGLALFLFFTIPTWARFINSQSWVETPAEVIWSTIRSHDSDDGTTYSADVFYRYRFNGSEHRSNTRSFMTGTSGGYTGSKEFVDAHPAGSSVTCYVNPEQPWQALLVRKPGWWMLLTLIPVPFMIVGLVAFKILRKHLQKKAVETRGLSSGLPLRAVGSDAEPSRQQNANSQTFKPHASRFWSFIITLILTLFWNGIVSVFVVQAFKSWRSSSPEWFLILFLIPFVLIGLVLLVASLLAFIGLFAAKPVLTLEPGTLVMGETVILSWRLSGGLFGLKSLSIYLVGEEEAQYVRGTTTTTDRHVFYEQMLFESTSAMEINLGSCSFGLPALTSPSWKSDNNAVKWSLRVRGKGSFYSHVSDDYEVALLPRDLV